MKGNRVLLGKEFERIYQQTDTGATEREEKEREREKLGKWCR